MRSNKGKLPKNFYDMLKKAHASTKGKPLSKEHKEKLSLILKGRKNEWLIGKKLSDEHKKSISESMKGKPSNNIMRGEDNPAWKGGITSQNKLDRVRFQQQIQKQVFERDNYKCVLCGEGGDIQVDHIQSWKDYVELRFNINNCRTLCMNCHYKITFGKPMPPTVRAWGHNFSRRAIL